jgi:hypothetical protein
MQVSFDRNAIGVVIDVAGCRALGTAFVFMRNDWALTAKHVVQQEGLFRSNLAIQSLDGTREVSVLAVHPEIDIAVLRLSSPALCSRPLFPAFAGFADSEGLIAIGYFPTKSKQAGKLILEGYPIARYEIEARERALSSEETIRFHAPASEGGNSGSPVLGASSGVVGMVIEHRGDDANRVATATSLSPLLAGLSFDPDWRASK